MSDDSAMEPFHVWMPTTCAYEDVTALQLSSDGDSVELVFIGANGLGAIHHLSRADFVHLVTLAAEKMSLHRGAQTR